MVIPAARRTKQTKTVWASSGIPCYMIRKSLEMLQNRNLKGKRRKLGYSNLMIKIKDIFKSMIYDNIFI